MQVRVLNLGAGVQSSRIYLEMIDGTIPPVDYAIFADTGDEPRDVYLHLDALETLRGPEIVRVSAGNLGDNLIRGVNSTGERFVSIPTFLSIEDNGQKTAIGRRQCTNEYKVKPIEAEIRRRLGILPGRQIPKGVEITQVFGLSFDEPRRVARVRDQFRSRRRWSCDFPLFDNFVTRAECLTWLNERLPNWRIPRSACLFCPYHNDDEWLQLKTHDPVGWAKAVEIDEAIRLQTSVCTKGMNAKQYLHPTCRPLQTVHLEASPPDRQKRFAFSSMDCEGMCGT